MDAVTLLWSEIAQRVATEVGARVAPAEEAAIMAPRTGDLTAYRLINLARGLWTQRTAPEIREAIGLFDEAIALDPGYTDAYVGLAEACLYLGLFSEDREEAIESFERAVRSAEKALELDSNAGGAHAVIGGVEFWHKANFEGAEREFRAAISLAPDHAFAHYWYAMYLSAMARHEEAFHELSIALSLDPLTQAMAHGPAKLYFQAGEYAQAVAEGLKTAEVYPNHPPTNGWLCQSYLMLRRFEEARESCEASQSDIEGGAYLGLYYAVRGDREAALREVEEARAAGGSGGGELRYGIPSALGDIDEAIRELRDYIDVSAKPPVRIRVNPFLDPLRSDPRFIEILRDMGLEG
jgi:tetratricopeptide (TPR) repeat protein